MRTKVGWLVIGLMLLAGVACGGDDASEPAADQETTPQDAATSPAELATTPGEQEAASRCDDTDPIKVGLMQPLSGPASSIGEQAQHGVDMAVADTNETGGILGRCVDVIAKDDGGDPTQGSQVARDLVDAEDVDFIVGTILSGPTGTAIEVTRESETPYVALSALASTGDAAEFPHVYSTEVSTTQQAETFVTYMESAGWQSGGILAVNTSLGTDITDTLQGDDRIEITTAEFHEIGAVDLTPQVDKVMQTDPDVFLMLTSTVPDVISTLSSRQQLGWEAPVLGFSSSSFREVTEGVGFDQMEEVYSGQAYASLARTADGGLVGGDRVAEFIDAYRAFLGVEEIPFSIQQAAGGWDSFKLMADAIEAAGSTEPAAIKSQLESAAYDGIKADYEYSADDHGGVGLDDLAFIIARSFDENGTYELAPNQNIGE